MSVQFGGPDERQCPGWLRGHSGPIVGWLSLPRFWAAQDVPNTLNASLQSGPRPQEGRPPGLLGSTDCEPETARVWGAAHTEVHKASMRRTEWHRKKIHVPECSTNTRPVSRRKRQVRREGGAGGKVRRTRLRERSAKSWPPGAPRTACNRLAQIFRLDPKAWTTQ